MSLTWVDNSSNETGFELERSVNGGAFALLISLPSNTVSYVDAAVVASTTYAYRVRAVNTIGPSAYSNTASVTTPALSVPARPTNLTVTNLAQTSLTLNWTDNSNNETGFTVQLATNSSFSSNVQTFSHTIGGTMTDTTAAKINATNLGCSITCKDLEASIRFYRDAIGFAVAQTFENEGKVVAALVAAGDCRIVLNQDDGQLGWDRIKGQGFYLQINVSGAADVDAAAARIKAGGGALLSDPEDRPWGARMFQFNDLDGFKLGVSTPLAG